jgi:Arc/MetJ-type ribon-helix-helix transcriptional regulator
MNTLTIKIPPDLNAGVGPARVREYLSKSEVVRRAVAAYLAQPDAAAQQASALAQAGDLVGCFIGGPRDLSSNPRYLDDFGRR